jgi:hypothetical protein
VITKSVLTINANVNTFSWNLDNGHIYRVVYGNGGWEYHSTIARVSDEISEKLNDYIKGNIISSLKQLGWAYVEPRRNES